MCHMREDYPITKPKDSITLEIEAKVIEQLKQMAKHTNLTEAEIANSALKRFIATHKDFLPPSAGGSKLG